MNLLLVLGALGIFLLGFTGWRELDDQRQIGMDRLTVFYRSIALFAGEAAEAYNVPVALQAARILALVVVFFSLLVGVVRFMTEQLMAKGARMAADHTVMIGPPELPETVLAARSQQLLAADGSFTVRVASHDGVSTGPNTVQRSGKRSGGADRITVHVDLDTHEWLAKTGATRARLVVLSDESDRQTIRLARQLLAAGQANGAHLIVNLNRWETAQWFDLYIAQRHPGASVEVGCVAEAAIIEQVVRRLPDLAQPGVTQPELAVAGRSGSRDVVLRLLVRQLTDYYYGHYVDAPPQIHLVYLDGHEQPGPVGVGSDFICREPLVLCSGDTKLDPLRRALIFVVDDDPDEAAQLELQLLTRFAADEVVMRLDPDSLMREAGTMITRRAAMHILRGPVYALSQSLVEDAYDGATNERRIDLTGRDDAPVVTRDQLQQTRQIIARLGQEGQVIIARDGPPDDNDDELSNEQLDAITKGFASVDSTWGPRSVRGAADASNVRAELTRAGYDFDVGGP